MENLGNAIAVANALAILVGAIGTVLFWRVRKRNEEGAAKQKEASAADVIADAAKKLLEPLTEKVEKLEATNKRLEKEVAELRAKVEQYIKDEVAYQAELHSKDTEIRVLKVELAEAKGERNQLGQRVVHLEDVVKRAELDGEE